MFHVRDARLELRRRSPDELAVDGRWINRTGLVAEGLAAQPYLHLDIRTPFGESVDEHQVVEALAESLGPRRDRYRLAGWHIQFVEDTNLGSNHRVFVDLVDASSSAQGQAGMDAGLSLELAMESLGDLVAAEKGEASFQLLYGGRDFCYSLLYLNGGPFHLLRVDEGAGPAAAVRLKRHREFAAGRSANGTLRTYLAKGDALWETAAAKDTRAEAFLLPGAGAAGEALLHLGLAQAARQRDFFSHNRVPADARRRNESIRTRFRFFVAVAASAAIGALAAGLFALAIQVSKSRLATLRAQASAYQAQVDTIRDLRREKGRLETAVEDLRPMWRGPIDWTAVMAALSEALPREAGIDGLNVARAADGSIDIAFRAWVRDWNQVQSIQKKLAAGKRFSNISLSEQRKDMASGVVIFNVTARLGGG